MVEPANSTAAPGSGEVRSDGHRGRGMRIGNYVVRPESNCWVVATIKTFRTGSQAGEEYESDVVYPARFDQALRTLQDRMLRDGIEPDVSLKEAVATVAYFYATIGRAAASLD